MTQGNGKPHLYRVIVSEMTKANVKALHLQAFHKGRGAEFVAAFRQIIDELRTRPLEFGEPLYRLPALKLVVRQGVVGFLIVDYGVHESEQLVFISGFKLLA